MSGGGQFTASTTFVSDGIAVPQTRIIRRHKARKDDGKGLRRFIAGQRFRLPTDVSQKEAEQRFLRLEELWEDNEHFCQGIGRRPHWTYIALFAAESIRKGELRVSIPPVDYVLASFGDSDYAIDIKCVMDHYLIEDETGNVFDLKYPKTVDGMEWDEAKKFYEFLSHRFPSVNWVLPDIHRVEVGGHPAPDHLKQYEEEASLSLTQCCHGTCDNPFRSFLLGPTRHEHLNQHAHCEYMRSFIGLEIPFSAIRTIP